MITIVETSKKTRTLNTPEDVAEFLRRTHRSQVRNAKFKYGEVVQITNRAGIPPDICIGDRAVYLYEDTGGHTARVLALNAGGAPAQFPVQLVNLAKREAVEAGE